MSLGIVKRFIDALKGETFDHDVFPSFIESFKSLVKSSLNAEIFRSLALFITYALHKPTPSASRTPMSRHGAVLTRPILTSAMPKRPTLTTSVDSKQSPNSLLTKQQVGTSILEMYAELLCEKGSTADLKKFARTVTNKVCHYLSTIL